MQAPRTPAQTPGANQSSNGQTLGSQVTSFAGVVVVALVEFGVPLTPGQQSIILSLVVTGWSLARSVYNIHHHIGNPVEAQQPAPRHRTPRKAKKDA